MAKKIISILGAALFVAFASLQTNDVTQYHTASWLQQTWLLGYAVLALLFLYNAFKHVPAKTFYVLGVITLALTLFRGSQINWDLPLFCVLSPDDPAYQNPAGNETGGLLIVTAWTFLVAYFTKNSQVTK
mgnify:CR=1 FL=1